MKHTPERSCIACRRKAAKSELIRIVKKSDGSIVLDEKGTESGRGAYVCRSEKCMADTVKKHALNRTFKEQLDSSVYVALEKAFGELVHGE